MIYTAYTFFNVFNLNMKNVGYKILQVLFILKYIYKYTVYCLLIAYLLTFLGGVGGRLNKIIS